MEISSSVKKRFVKDYDLPITIMKEPWWSYYMDLYDNLFQTHQKLESLQKLLRRLGDGSDFFNESDRITTSIIKDISKTQEYKDFLVEDMTKYSFANAPKNTQLYIPENADRYFLSVDMSHANYQALKFVNCVLYTKDWEELLGWYTQDEYFHNSKYLRQVIFGNLNPKRQRTLIRYLNRSKVLTVLIRVGCPIVNFSEDQCVIDITDKVKIYGSLNSPLSENLKNVTSEITEKVVALLSDAVQVHIEGFKLKRLSNKPYYVKEKSDGTVKFCCCPAHYFSEIYRFYYREPLSELDGFTFYDGRAVRYITPLFEYE